MRPPNKIVLVLLALGVLNIFVWANFFHRSPREARFLDVGQGDAILITDNYTQVLVDAGPGGHVAASVADAMPYFDRTIDLLVITHFDHDHFAGAFALLDKYKIGAVVLHPAVPNKTEAEEFMKQVNEKGIKILSPVAGQSIVVGSLDLEVLHPFVNQQAEGNDRSIVLKLNEAGGIMLTGDIGILGQRIMSRTFKDRLKSDVLKVAHHGSKNNIYPDFNRYVSPEAAVISVGAKNRYEHPHKEVLETFKELKLFRTDESGTIRFLFDKNQLIT